jgi:predicted molibdopterin-dependent oxidoreductase YjgC
MRPFIEIHPQDAEARGIETGERVRAFNDRGSCELSAVVTTRARPGVVVSPSVWWNKHSPGRVNVNQLTSQTLTDMGGGATFYDALVEVERVKDGAQVQEGAAELDDARASSVSAHARRRSPAAEAPAREPTGTERRDRT